MQKNCPRSLLSTTTSNFLFRRQLDGGVLRRQQCKPVRHFSGDLPEALTPRMNAGTPTKKTITKMPSSLANVFSRSSSGDEMSATTDTGADFTDARESVGTITPAHTISELPTDTEAEAYMTGREYQTSLAPDSEASDDEEREDDTRRATIRGLGLAGTQAWSLRHLASRDAL